MSVAFTLGAYPTSRTILRVDRYGIPRADVWLPDDVTTLAEGQRAVLSVGDATYTGTLGPGGVFGGSSTWTFIGGAGGWDLPCEAKAYSETAGVRLAAAVLDLARSVGETREGVPVVADRSLGIAWTREAGLASEAIEALSLPAGATRGTPGQWWVDAAGVTHVGPRAATAYAAPATLTVPRFNPATLAATLVPADGAIAALVPSCVLTHPDLPSPLTIGSVIIRAEAERVEVDVIGEMGTAELFRALVASMVAPDRYARLAPMQVAEVRADGRASVVPQPGDQRALPIPGSPLLTQLPGVPGCTATLTVGMLVLVGWPAADPGSPRIVAFDPSVPPASLSFQAGALAMNGPTTVGGPVGSGFPAAYVTPTLTTWIAAVSTALGLSPPPLASTTTKVVP